MPDPASLPLEVFDKILDNLQLDIPAGPPTIYDCGDHDIKQLYTFSLVNRTWHKCSIPRLYSRWTYQGERHSFPQLWKFLRTVVINTEIAELVRTLDIRRWDLDPTRAGKVCCYDDFSVEDVKSVSNALHLAGISTMEYTMLQALRENDRMPLVALLMTCLPRLTYLNVVVQDIDKYFAQVLNLASRHEDSDQYRRRAFQNLREASFRTPGKYESSDYRLSAEDLRPMYHLPNIQKLSIFDIMSGGVADHPDGVARTSPITHLTLSHWAYSHVTLTTAQTLLTLPRTLVYLSFHFNDSNLIPSPTKPKPVSNDKLWNILVLYQTSIKYLDFYRDGNGSSPPVHSSTNSHMGLLHGFKHLKTLCIQPEVLLGGCCGGEKASFRLCDTLPQALESLTFYGDEGLANNRELEGQLVEVVHGNQFAHLKSIVLEDVDAIARHFIHPVDLPRLELEQACKAMDVRLRIAERDTLPKGGHCLPYIMETHETNPERNSRLRELWGETISDVESEEFDSYDGFMDSDDSWEDTDDNEGSMSNEDSSSEGDSMATSEGASGGEEDDAT